MWCAVRCCNNNNDMEKPPENISYHAFPKMPKLLRIWKIFCKRKNSINPKTARICSKHFVREDFINYLQYEMGFANKLMLKTNAIPTIYNTTLNESPSLNAASRNERVEGRERKKIIETLMDKSSYIEEAELVIKSETPEQETFEPEHEVLEETYYIKEVNEVNAEMENLKAMNQNLKECNEKYQEEIVSLKIKLDQSEFHRKNLEERLEEIFTVSQIKKIKNGSKRLIWSEEDVARSLTLYSASPRAYKLLRSKQFPLPSPRTLNSWVHKIDTSTEIIDKSANGKKRKFLKTVTWKN